MAQTDVERQWIAKFQENLSIIRKVAGWTTQQLADELGVARQTVSNLETGKSPMTKLQYLALRTVFNAEIARRENRDLAAVITTLVDDPLEHMFEEQDLREETVKHGGQSTEDTMRQSQWRSRFTAMRMLTLITGALASGAAAGFITYLLFPDGKR